MLESLFRWLDAHVLHARLRDGGPDVRRRAHLAVVFAVISGVGACALGANHVAYGIPMAGVAFISFGLSAGIAVYVMRRTGSLVFVGNVVAALWFCAMVASTVSRGGLMSHGSMGVAAVPVVAVVLAGRRSGWVWCLFSLALLLALFAIDAAGVNLPDRAPPESRHLIAVISAGLFALLMFLMAAAHESMKSAAIRELARTERAKLAAETEAKLHEADRLAAVGRLSSAVAHEINNPLSYILGNASYLLEELDGGELTDREAAREALTDVIEGAEHVSAIVRDLNTFARTEEDVGNVDVAASVAASMRMAAHQIRFRARLRTEIETGAAVRANPGRLGQVLLNLLVNAAHAIPPGRADEHEICVRVREHAPYVAIEVVDTGTGIPRELLARVTEPFFTTKPVGEGTGLGLAVCKNLIERYSGRLEIESEPGRGTTVRILLPRAEEGFARRAPRAKRARPRTAGEPRRVLIVDDDERMLRHMHRTLEQHDVVTVNNGREALELLAGGGDYELILCDLMMPDVTGADVYESLCARRPELARRFVLVTGGAFSQRTTEFMARFDGRVARKPLSDRDLRALVDRMAA